jgi:hypothetical protein
MLQDLRFNKLDYNSLMRVISQGAEIHLASGRLTVTAIDLKWVLYLKAQIHRI